MFRATIMGLSLAILLVATAAATPIHEAATAGEIETVRNLIDDNPELLNAPDDIGGLPIHAAASNGHLEIVRLLLDRGVQVDAPDRESTTPLGVAGLGGHYETGKFLIERGASVTVADDAGTTPLLWAAQGGSIDLVKLLLEKGASVEERSLRNTGALHFACFGGNFEIGQFLIESGASVTAADDAGTTPMLGAAQGGNIDLIELLLEKGASLEERTARNTGVLHYACYGGHRPLVDYLLEKSFDINERNASGYTPIHFASFRSQNELIPYLIERGADIMIRNDEGESLLHFAVDRRDTVLAGMLLAGGMDINVMSNHGQTAMVNAALWSQSMVPWLIEHGAAVNPISDSGDVPLKWSVQGGDTSVVRALLTAGARVNCRSSDSDTPLQTAVSRGRLEITRILLEAGADPKLVESHYGQTPLHQAAVRGHAEMVELLVSHGAVLDATDNLNKRPLHYAAQYGHQPVAEFLKTSGASTAGVTEDYGPPSDLLNAPNSGEAVVHYLGHSGWAVRTANNFLIFDYHEMHGRPDRPCLANGFITANEIKELPVTVFSSHEHGDHYDTVIFSWRDQVEDITYVLGHQPADRTGYEYIAPRGTQNIGDLKVTTITSTDAGVGYVVEVDGLTIFHAGDHSAGTVDVPEAYRVEIDYIAETCPPPDLAFLPISGCSLGTPESVKAGVYWTLDELHPRVLFPQHRGGHEYALSEFEQEARERNVTTAMRCAGHRGDVFVIGQNIGI